MLALYSLVTLLLTIAATPLLTRLMGRNAGSVSYTHLTLPTICSV